MVLSLRNPARVKQNLLQMYDLTVKWVKVLQEFQKFDME